jgi:hypothetical protein
LSVPVWKPPAVSPAICSIFLLRNGVPSLSICVFRRQICPFLSSPALPVFQSICPCLPDLDVTSYSSRLLIYFNLTPLFSTEVRSEDAMGCKAPLFLALLLFLAGWGAAQARTDASQDKDDVGMSYCSTHPFPSRFQWCGASSPSSHHS